MEPVTEIGAWAPPGPQLSYARQAAPHTSRSPHTRRSLKVRPNGLSPRVTVLALTPFHSTAAVSLLTTILAPSPRLIRLARGTNPCRATIVERLNRMQLLLVMQASYESSDQGETSSVERRPTPV